MFRFAILFFAVWVGMFSLAHARDSHVERSSLFSLSPTDVIEDAGVITITSGRSVRTEFFETVKHRDGGRTTTSIIKGPGGTYRVEGRWVYDAAGSTLSANGLGAYHDLPAKVDITASRPSATITVNVNGQARAITAPCGADCLIDLSPSVMAMFNVTRQFDAGATDQKNFQWIGQALHRDQTLTAGGGSDVRLHATHVHGDINVMQFLFFETLPGDQHAAPTEAAFNLYVDGDHRPLAFATSRGTQAVRSGYESVMQQFPPVFGD